MFPRELPGTWSEGIFQGIHNLHDEIIPCECSRNCDLQSDAKTEQCHFALRLEFELDYSFVDIKLS